jgi:hypothetical protein
MWVGAGNSAVGHGAMALTANFATSSITGTMTGFSLTDETGFHGGFNDLSFAASLSPSLNLFTGTLSVTSAPGGLFGMPSGSTGTIRGLFFGPSAQEVGGAWALHAPGAAGGAVGAFAGKQ